MNIRFTSSLTPDDENRVAPAVLTAVTAILDVLPIAYAIRIDTSDGRVYQQRSPAGPGHRAVSAASLNARPADAELR